MSSTQERTCEALQVPALAQRMRFDLLKGAKDHFDFLESVVLALACHVRLDKCRGEYDM